MVYVGQVVELCIYHAGQDCHAGQRVVFKGLFRADANNSINPRVREVVNSVAVAVVLVVVLGIPWILQTRLVCY